MSTTRAELRAKVRSELASTDPEGSIWGDSKLNDYINQAILNIQTDAKFEFSENKADTTLTTTNGEVDLPDDYGRMTRVFIGNDKLERKEKIELKQAGLLDNTGIPLYYYTFGTKLGVSSTISQSVDLYYLKMLDGLYADTDLLPYPDSFVLTISVYATYLAWNSPEGNLDSARAKLSEYQTLLNTLLDAYTYKDRQDLNYSY